MQNPVYHQNSKGLIISCKHAPQDTNCISTANCNRTYKLKFISTCKETEETI